MGPLQSGDPFISVAVVWISLAVVAWLLQELTSKPPMPRDICGLALGIWQIAS